MRLQLAAGSSVAQAPVAEKAAVVVVGAAIVSVAAPVLVRRTGCDVAAVPGTLANVSEVGFSATPGSAVPVPVRLAVAERLPEANATVPALVPTAVGENASANSQDAPNASVPEQAGAPVAVATRAKSPVRTGPAIASAAPVADALVSV